jgi:hypothetical protein
MASPDDIKRPFVPERKHGYSCQTVLSARVNEFLHPGTYYCWLSTEFNPAKTGNSSNPCSLYTTLSKAVQEDDTGDAKVQQIRTALLEAVTRKFPIEENQDAARAIVHVRHAVIDLFRPQIWRVDLKKVADRMTSGHQYPYEHKVEDLKCQEFEVIIE